MKRLVTILVLGFSVMAFAEEKAAPAGDDKPAAEKKEKKAEKKEKKTHDKADHEKKPEMK